MRGIAHLRVCLTVLVLLFGSTGVLKAQTLFETLVNPGPVIKGHEKVEADCIQCHVKGDRHSQASLCVVCHKDVAQDRQQARGYHGRDAQAVKSECRQCHTDHKGRTADVVQLDRETFNHNQTNFKLVGRHVSTRCDACHAAGKAMRTAPGQCVDCHKKVDAHNGRLGPDCGRCHTEDGWARTRTFDHDKTKFPLVGAHRKVDCAACHIGQKYKDLGTACVSCHSIQDKHGGRYGAKCETCHRSEKWSTISFNHDRDTRFQLKGGHARVKCDACHTGSLYGDKLATTCISCHRKDDPHKGQLGQRCEQCHSESGWKRKTNFDHDVTRFPLVGKHKVVVCEQCHHTARFKETPSACADCHKDVFHDGRLAINCGSCHNPTGWKRWTFNHDKQTRFALTGAHQTTDCHACHRNKVQDKIRLPMTCIGCHSADDVHGGSFGINCEQCHNTVTFKQRAIRR